jgi:hypothetical protein
MRRLVDRTLAAVTLALLAGGWVCQSNVDNRCPGALTCEIEVANVCCPFESSKWCGSCVAAGTMCTQPPHICLDESRVLDCSFSAKIQTAQCINPVSGSEGVTWTLQASGTIDGCGQETAFVSVAGQVSDVSCGSWSVGVYGGCIPTEAAMSTTTWLANQAVFLPAGQGAQVAIEIKRAHGANPVLARQMIACGPWAREVSARAQRPSTGRHETRWQERIDRLQ